MKLGFCSVLTLIFVIFKLMGMFDIGWLWVFSPLWIGYSAMLLMTLIFGITAFFLSYVGNDKK